MSDVPKKKIKEIKYLVAAFDENMDAELFKIIAMSSICRIFNSKQLCDVIGGILSLYALMNGIVLEDETLQNSLLDEGFKLNGLKIQGKNDLSNCIKFIDSELNAKFLSYLNAKNVNNDNASIRIRRVSNIFKERFSSINFPVGFIIAFTGLCLCLMCKKLTKYNHFSWVRQKWKSFLGIVGLNQQYTECGPSHNLMPGLNVCRNVYSFFKLHHALRRRLYLGIMKLSWESGMWGNMCRAVLRFSKGLEMNHIVLINTYILQDHPTLIHVEELKPEFRKLQSTFQIFLKMNIPEEQWPYIQIMTKLSNDIWSKKIFPILSYLAVQVGKRIRTNLGDYHCELSSEMQDKANRIMSEIINFDSTSQIVQGHTENASENVDAQSDIGDDEFGELFKISDILEKSLNRLSGVRNFNEDVDLILLPNAIPSTKMKYFRTSSDLGADLVKIVCMLNISRIYQDECLTEVIGGVLTLFTAVDSETVSSDECKLSMKKHGFELSEILLESENDLASHFIFENEQLNNLFLKYLGLACLDSSFHTVVIKDNSIVSHTFKKFFLKTEIPNISAYIGLYLLPIFKQLDENNHASWLEHKWDTFCRITNLHDELSNFSMSPVPSQSTCCCIYSFFYSNFELRRALFLKCLDKLTHLNLTGLIFLVICENAKEMEINHIYLINCCILQQKKYFLKMKELKPELSRFMRALEDMRCKMPSVEGWVHIKLLCHPNEVEFLNKNNFPLLLYLAKSFRDSKNKPKYAGVGTVTEYFKKVEETAKMFRKFYDAALREKSIQKFFGLNFSNGDLLSTIEDEQLKQLTINSMLLSTCHDHQLGIIPDDKKQQIISMSLKEVKKGYKHFKQTTIKELAILISQCLGPSATVTIQDSDGGEHEINSNKDQTDLSDDESQNSLSDFQNNLLEDPYENDVSEFQDDLLEDAYESNLSDFQNDLLENAWENNLSDFHDDLLEDALENNLSDFHDDLLDDVYESYLSDF